MKKIDLDKADVVKQEICPRDELKHVTLRELKLKTKHVTDNKAELKQFPTRCRVDDEIRGCNWNRSTVLMTT